MSFRVKGQPNLEFPIDRAKCQTYGASDSDVLSVLKSAVGGQPCSTMIEGEKKFDITLRWPAVKRQDETSILEIPVDIGNVNLSPGFMAGTQQTPWTGSSQGPATGGTSIPYPALVSAGIAPL